MTWWLINQPMFCIKSLLGLRTNGTDCISLSFLFLLGEILYHNKYIWAWLSWTGLLFLSSCESLLCLKCSYSCVRVGVFWDLFCILFYFCWKEKYLAKKKFIFLLMWFLVYAVCAIKVKWAIQVSRECCTYCNTMLTPCNFVNQSLFSWFINSVCRPAESVFRRYGLRGSFRFKSVVSC